MKVVLATGNAGKQREFAALLAPLGLELVLQSALGIVPAEETGTTFEANALLKARHAAAHAGLPALADDSGLEVDALNGRPGVYSARYAGAAASDDDNNALLVRELAAVPEAQRTARYRCVLALVRSADDAAPLLAEGSWEGRIALEPAGEGGFGYDPWFIPAGHGVTSAQLPAATKNALSHRGKALQALIARLPAWR
jgi:XTP/dITP diphosphohydrolase